MDKKQTDDLILGMEAVNLDKDHNQEGEEIKTIKRSDSYISLMSDPPGKIPKGLYCAAELKPRIKEAYPFVDPKLFEAEYQNIPYDSFSPSKLFIGFDNGGKSDLAVLSVFTCSKSNGPARLLRVFDGDRARELYNELPNGYYENLLKGEER